MIEMATLDNTKKQNQAISSNQMDNNQADTSQSESVKASFSIGQVIQHRRYSYRGVIIDVDPVFQGSDEWYDEHASDMPPKESPWYHVIIDEDDVVAYVAEPYLTSDDDDTPVQHPMIDNFFSGYDAGRYTSRNVLN